MFWVDCRGSGFEGSPLWVPVLQGLLRFERESEPMFGGASSRGCCAGGSDKVSGCCDSGGEAAASARQAGSERWLIPRSDVIQQEGSVVLVIDMPGVAENDANIEVEEGVLTVSGKVTGRMAANSQGWKRRFLLADEFDLDNVQAALKNGVLRIELRRAERAKPRKIVVKAE